jgi:perosamine synthetase
MKVPQFVSWVGDDEYRAIGECFANNWITEGPKAKLFTERLIQLTGAKYGVLAPNGTHAIYLGLVAAGIGPGDEVLVPDFTFIASGTAVVMAGATPVFVDVNQRNFQIDVDKAEALVTPRTKAIMPVHMYGTVADMDSVMAFAGRYGLAVVEDAAQAIGVHYKGRHAGTFGTAGAFSFFADKTITTAEGGFVATNDADVYDRLLYLRNQGRKDRGTFIHPEIGYNFRMTDIQCAVGLVQLDKLGAVMERKARLLATYQRELAGIKQVRFFQPDNGAEWIPFRVPLICERASELSAFLAENEVEPRTFFYPLHRQPAFAEIIKKTRQTDPKAFAWSDYAFEHGICLPTFPTLTDEQIQYVAGHIRKFYD